MITHPYINYGIALVMEENNLHSQSEICLKHIVNEINKGLNSFRLKPNGNYEGKDSIGYVYTIEDGSAKDYLFLSPHVITTDMQAHNLRGAAQKYINNSSDTDASFLEKSEKIGMSEVPITGEFACFSKNIGRGVPRATKAIQGYGLVTSLTQYKPAISITTKDNGKPSYSNVCIIPDLNVPEMIEFIKVFKRLMMTETADLFVGNVVEDKLKYIPKRPKIWRGNYPNAPQSVALGCIALLAAIGEFGKKEEDSETVKKVLERLKDRSIYIVKYGEAKGFSYNHYIIDLAKSAKLSSVVDSIYYSKLYNQDRRTWDNTEYQKFDMSASRFLQLFNRYAFEDFFSFRAEYPNQIEILFTTFFNKIEKMDKEVIDSVKCLGEWLNKVAYKAAIEDKESKLDIRQKKSKTLVELESSIYASKTPDALLAQTITRAGRLSDSDAPADASLFMEETLAGNIDFNVAKNMLIAFSRIRTSKRNTPQEDSLDIPLEDENAEDFSQI